MITKKAHVRRVVYDRVDKLVLVRSMKGIYINIHSSRKARILYLVEITIQIINVVCKCRDGGGD